MFEEDRKPASPMSNGIHPSKERRLGRKIKKYNYTRSSLLTCRSFTFNKTQPSALRERCILGFTIVITIGKEQ